MKMLVINSGSSSLKYQLFDTASGEVLVKGLCDRIGMKKSVIKVTKPDQEPEIKSVDLKNHRDAIQKVINLLTDKDQGVIGNISEIKAIGHRIAHGGDKFSDSVIIDEAVLNAIFECSDLAPLHNPAMLAGIKACRAIMPDVPMVAVFDTAFHQTLPQKAFIYAIPYEYYEKYKIRKYGFHGTSHKYLAHRAAELIGKPIESLKLITCHLGNGASICAIQHGKSVETSMGFTPLDGLVMGTRCGTIDPLIFKFIMDKEGLNGDDINVLLNSKSGVLGISGISSDFRDLQASAANGNQRAALALDIFSYRVKGFIGNYVASMNGVDAIVFSGGIGENDSKVRYDSLKDMDYLGIGIDQDKNHATRHEADISSPGASVRTYVIPTNEELAIAREVASKLGWQFHKSST